MLYMHIGAPTDVVYRLSSLKLDLQTQRSRYFGYVELSTSYLKDNNDIAVVTLVGIVIFNVICYC